MAGGSGLTRGTVSLTQRSIDALRPSEAPFRVSDQRCIGLAIRVAPSGIKTWDLAYRIRGAGKARRLSLGRVADLSLEKARVRSNELTTAARNGRDRIADEAEARAAMASRITVNNLIDLYVRRRVKGRLRTAKEIESRLKRTLASVLARHADDLRRRDIRELLDCVAEQGIEREAEKRRQTVGAMFRWALSQDMVEIDPTAGLRTYDPGTPRDRVLSADEISSLWKWLETGALPPDPADILRLQIATGARCGEISGICAEEIDREHWTWTLPAARSKNKKSRVTPLAGIARQILETRIASAARGPLFSAETGKPFTSAHIGHYVLSRLDKIPVAKFTTHDLRRTVATTLAEMGISYELIAAVIGHESGGKDSRTLVRHYVRSDLIERKRAVLESWDCRLREIVEGIVANKNVTWLDETRKPRAA
jgi:integrase